MDDELEFLDFLALIEVNGWHDRLSCFSLYDPERDKYFSFIKIGKGNVRYKLPNSNSTLRSFQQLQHWFVIILDKALISEIQPFFEDHLSWKIHLTYSIAEGVVLEAKNSQIEKKFLQKITTNQKQDRLDMIQEIDTYIISKPRIFQEFSELIDNYHGLKIYRFKHFSGVAFMAATDDFLHFKIINSNDEFQYFEKLYQNIDMWVLEDEDRFNSIAHALDTPLSTKTYYLEGADEVFFKSYFDQEKILEFSCSGRFQECFEHFSKELEKTLIDKVLIDKELYDFVAESNSYGSVLQLQYIDFQDQHHVKIKIGETEVVSCFGEGKAEPNSRLYIDDAIEKNLIKFREVFEDNHRDFNQSRFSNYNSNSIIYVEQKYVRMTHCWHCKNNIDSRYFPGCTSCSGIICFCGACLCGTQFVE